MTRNKPILTGILIGTVILLVGISTVVVIADTSTSTTEPVKEWNNSYFDGEGYDIIETDNGYVAVGEYESGSSSHPVFIRLNQTGGIESGEIVNFNGVFHGVTPTDDGNFIAVGGNSSYLDGTHRFETQKSDILIAKINPSGDTLWTKKYGGNDYDAATDIVPAHGDGYAISYVTESYGPGGEDPGILRIDSTGDVLNSENYGTAEYNETGEAIERLSSGGYAITGSIDRPDVTDIAYITKVDSLLTQEGDTQTYGELEGATGTDLEEANDGHFILTGASFKPTDTYTGYVAKIDSTTGDLIWDKVFDRETFWALSVEQRNDGSLFVSGPQVYKLDMNIAFSLTSGGDINWETNITNSDEAWIAVYSGIPTSDGGFAVVGERQGTGFWVYKAEENKPPSPSLTVSPTEPTVGDAVTFDGSASTDPDDKIATYEWFVDGEKLGFDSGEQASYTFAQAGTHTVELRVTDSHGATNTTTTTVSVVSDNAAPTASFTVSPSAPAVGEAIVFDGSGSEDPDGQITAYEWDFDNDGTTDATGATPTYSYETAGEYTVSLTVTDDNDATHTVSNQISVADVQIAVSADPASQSTGVGGTAQFDVVVSGINNGVGAYEFNASVGDTNTAIIADVSLQGTNPDDSLTSVSYSGGNASVSVSAGDADHDAGVIATIAVEGTGIGTTTLALNNVIVGDDTGSQYTIDAVTNGSLSVEDAPVIVGSTPAQDLDGDGKYEDVNGDGEFNIVDVNALFQNYQTESVQNNKAAFDFNGDGSVNIVDVNALFQEAL